MNITPSLPHTRTFCSARFIVNITHQHNNNRNLQSHLRVQVAPRLSRWNFATYTRINMVFT